MLPADDVAEHGLDRLFVADQIVIDDEDDSEPSLTERLKLGQHLLARFEARPPAKCHDDIAELARERTAARDLQASEHVAIGFEQINARQRQPSHLGFILLLVAGLVAALLPLPQKLRPSLIRFANEDDVGKAFEDFRLDSRHGSANNDHDTPRLNLLEDLNQPTPLNAHAGQAHKIRPAETVEVDVLDILIDEHHLVMFGDKGRAERGRPRASWRASRIAACNAPIPRRRCRSGD